MLETSKAESENAAGRQHRYERSTGIAQEDSMVSDGRTLSQRTEAQERQNCGGGGGGGRW